jgi:hypothetical protein
LEVTRSLRVTGKLLDMGKYIKKASFLKMFFVGLLPIFFLLFSMIEPELGAGIDPGMAMTLTISV